jgi:hypothetical protein
MLRSVLGDERFDLVTAIDVLYHIVDEVEFAAALDGLAGKIAPGGCLLISDVFSERRTQVAPHVVRRPLGQYAELLSPRGVKLLVREPVFAVLGDPVPRGGFHLRDLAMLGTWRIVSKLVRTTPDAMRDKIGYAAARALVPIDTFLKRTGRAQGINLELALFRRAPAPP